MCTESSEMLQLIQLVRDLWDELTPHVAVMKPSSDLCFTCQQNNQRVMKAVNLPEAIRKQRFDDASRHRQSATTTACSATKPRPPGVHILRHKSLWVQCTIRMTLHSKYTFPLTHNRQDQHTSKQHASVGFWCCL